MQIILFLSLVLFLSSRAILSSFSVKKKYLLYEISAFNSRERKVLNAVSLLHPEVSFLNGVTNAAAIPMDVVVEKKYTNNFVNLLNTYNIQFTIVGPVLIPKNEKCTVNSNQFILNTTCGFYNWRTIKAWVLNIAKLNSNFVSLVQIGKSYELRELYLVKIAGDKSKNPAVIIVGGEEGRDWISPAIILNFMHQIIFHHTLLRQMYDFYLIPILNPDGYVHSMSKERFWARNRKTYYPPKICSNKKAGIGVNIDRNWLLSEADLFDSECNAIYFGHKGISEEETQALLEVVNSLSMNTMAFINVRGFNRLITIPYGYTGDVPNNYAMLKEILTAASGEVFKKHNVTYYFENSAHYLYNLSGTSADWVKYKLNIPVVFTFFMKHKKHVFPRPSDVQPLSDQFYTLIKETLTVSKDIYGPLFNHKPKSQNYQIFNLTLLIFISILLIKK